MKYHVLMGFQGRASGKEPVWMYWKNHNFDYTDLYWRSDLSAF